MTGLAPDPLVGQRRDWLRSLHQLVDGAGAVPAHEHGVAQPLGARSGAVLLLFGVDRDQHLDVLLTQRAHTLRDHPGQISFPGGAIDAGDDSPAAAAVREATEETGVDSRGVDIIGELPQLYIRPSNFLVTPVLAWWREPSPVAPLDVAEVCRVQRVRLADLSDPAHRGSVRRPGAVASPAFRLPGLFIWGFTAGLLARVITGLGLEQPWCVDQFFDLTEEHP
jgi:8-oxo-dGTP pyrophosphatase MutT (NUDIX family)